LAEAILYEEKANLGKDCSAEDIPGDPHTVPGVLL
jgi:hypothetical protein